MSTLSLQRAARDAEAAAKVAAAKKKAPKTKAKKEATACLHLLNLLYLQA